MLPPLSDALAHVVTGKPLPRSQDAIRADLCPAREPSPAERDEEAALRTGEALEWLRRDHASAIQSGDVERITASWWNLCWAMGWAS